MNGIKIIAIATDSVNHLKKFAEENDYNFTIVSDRGAKITKQYNVYTFGSPIDMVYLKTKLAIPSDFLIDRNHRIIWKYLGTRTRRPTISLLEKSIVQKIRVMKKE
jgi:peroxiredoxin